MILYHSDPSLTSHLIDGRYRRRFLVEGDSWFTIGGLTGNLLFALDNDTDLFVNCASPGDTSSEMVDQGAAFKHLLDPVYGADKWDAVLLSLGGNDLLLHCGRFVTPDPFNPLDEWELDRALDEIESNLLQILKVCAAMRPGIPVFVHTYDYPPVSRRWWWSLGPWISPVFKRLGLPRDRWDDLAAELIDELNHRFLNVLVDFPNLAIVDTRGALLAKQWQNEIHPTDVGYSILARKWRRKLNERTVP